VRLAAPARGRVRWLLRGPQGRVVDRRTLTIGARPVALVVRRLAAGRYRWEVAPTGAGPTRRGTADVPPPPPPPTPDPPVEPPPVPAVEQPAAPSSGPRHGGRPRHHGGSPSAQPEDPADAIDPDDIPEPVDPHP
ncbi:hypothetical protein, partial [Nocardioides sp.]|uniref:hypothetical protein n=1 Tax=Nocardioides sp. TaxID=35761 RepID=UPI0027225194